MKHNRQQWLSMIIACLLLIGQILPMGSTLSWAGESKTTTLSGMISLPEGMVVPAGKTFTVAFDYGYELDMYKKIVSISENQSSVRYEDFEVTQGDLPSVIKCVVLDDAGLDVVSSGYYTKKDGKETVTTNYAIGQVFLSNLGPLIANFNLEKGHRISGMIKNPNGKKNDHKLELYIKLNSSEVYEYWYRVSIRKKIEFGPYINEIEYSIVVPMGSYSMEYIIIEPSPRTNLLREGRATETFNVTSSLENKDIILQVGTRVHGLIMLPEEASRLNEKQVWLKCYTSGSAIMMPHYKDENGYNFGIQAGQKTMYYEFVVPKGTCIFELGSWALNIRGYSTSTGVTENQLDAEVSIVSGQSFEKNFVLRADLKEKPQTMLEKPEDVVVQGNVQLPEDVTKPQKVSAWHTKNGVRKKVFMKRMNNSVSNFDYNIILNGDEYNSVDDSPEFLEFELRDDFNNSTVTVFAKPDTNGVVNKADAKLNGMLQKGVFTANIDFRNFIPKGITLSKDRTMMSVGKSEKLLAKVTASVSSDKALVWTTNNPSVATVSDQGVVTPLTRGAATITATHGEYSASCQVIVKSIEPTNGREVYEISGKVNLPEGMTVPVGKNLKIVIREQYSPYEQILTIPAGHNTVSYDNLLVEGKGGDFQYSYLEFEIIDDAGLNIVGNAFYTNDGHREGVSTSSQQAFNLYNNSSLNIANFNLVKGHRVNGVIKKPEGVSVKESISVYVHFMNLDNGYQFLKNVARESNLDCVEYSVVVPSGTYKVDCSIDGYTPDMNFLTQRTVKNNLSVTSDISNLDFLFEIGTRIYGLIMLPEGAQRPTEDINVKLCSMTSGSAVNLEPSSYSSNFYKGIPAGYKTMYYEMIVPKGIQNFKVESSTLNTTGYSTATGLSADPKEAVASTINGVSVEKNFVLLPNKNVSHAIIPKIPEDVIMQGTITLPKEMVKSELVSYYYTIDNRKSLNYMFGISGVLGDEEYKIILPGDKIASVNGAPICLEFIITDETTGKSVSIFAKPGTNGVTNPTEAKLNGMTERGFVTANINPNLIQVGSLALNKTKSIMTIGKTETLQATLTPNDPTAKTFTWTSSNPSVATVNNQGVVTSIKSGVTTITAQHGKLSASCEVTVKGNDASLASVVINGKPLQGFNSTIKKYQLKEYTAGTKLDISAIATAVKEGALVKINDLNVPQSIILKQGINKVDIKVTAEDGTHETYTLEFIVPLPVTGQPVTIDPKTDKTVYLPPSMAKDKPLELAIDPAVKDVKLQLGTPVQEATTTSVNLTAPLKFKVNANGTGYGNVSVEMPTDVKVSSLTANKWDGQMALPTVEATPSQTSVTIGVQGMELTFNKPVRIVIPNMANKAALWKQGDKSQEITYTLTSDSLQAAMNELTNGMREAKVSTGDDLVIWTTHFTEFVAYTPVKVPAAFGGGGGGGAPMVAGGGGGAPVNTAEQTTPVATIDTTKTPAQTSTTEPVVTKNQSAATLKDISNHWAQANIMALAEKKIVSGNTDGKFMPEQAVTRAEFVSMLVKALDLKGTNGKVFSDTKKHWAADAISIAVANGLVSGYEKDQFKPDHTITREEMAVILAKAKKLDLKAVNQVAVKDQKAVSPWALSSVQAMMLHKLVKGYEDGSFKPQQNLTKAEAATLILKLL